MSQFPRSTTTNVTSSTSDTARFMSRVYAWMTFGILISGCVAWKLGQDPAATMRIAGAWFMPIMIAQLGCVFALSFAINRINAMAATALYLGYAALTGVAFSILFMVYTKESMENVFWLTSAGFAGLSSVGYFTKRDLGPVGSFCTFGLFGLVAYGILSMFFPGMQSAEYGNTYSFIGLLVFAGLTAYDTQKIKTMYATGDMDSDDGRKKAIFGALALYLDFVNLFLNILRLMGRRK